MARDAKNTGPDRGIDAEEFQSPGGLEEVIVLLRSIQKEALVRSRLVADALLVEEMQQRRAQQK